jgi:hypothetical protein
MAALTNVALQRIRTKQAVAEGTLKPETNSPYNLSLNCSAWLLIDTMQSGIDRLTCFWIVCSQEYWLTSLTSLMTVYSMQDSYDVKRL